MEDNLSNFRGFSGNRFSFGPINKSSQMVITPNDLTLLIHFYVCPDKHPRADAPACQETIQAFLNNGIITPAGDSYKTTPKGEKWLDMILSTPMPVKRYADPREDKYNGQ